MSGVSWLPVTDKPDRLELRPSGRHAVMLIYDPVVGAWWVAGEGVLVKMEQDADFTTIESLGGEREYVPTRITTRARLVQTPRMSGSWRRSAQSAPGRVTKDSVQLAVGRSRCSLCTTEVELFAVLGGSAVCAGCLKTLIVGLDLAAAKGVSMTPLQAFGKDVLTPD